MDNQNTNTLSNDDSSRGVSNVNSSSTTTVPFDELNAVPSTTDYNQIQPESNVNIDSLAGVPESTTPSPIDTTPTEIPGSLPTEDMTAQQPAIPTVSMDPSPVSQGSNLDMNSVPTTPVSESNMPSEGLNFTSGVTPMIDTPMESTPTATDTPPVVDFGQTPVVEQTPLPETPVVEQAPVPETPVMQPTETPFPDTPVVEQTPISETPVVSQTETPFADTPVVESPTTDTPVVAQENPMELIPPTVASSNTPAPPVANAEGSEIVNTLEEVNKEGKGGTIIVIALVVIIVILLFAIGYFGYKIMF